MDTTKHTIGKLLKTFGIKMKLMIVLCKYFDSIKQGKA